MNDSQKQDTRDLGVGTNEVNIFLYSNLAHTKDDTFRAGISEDGLHFKQNKNRPRITLSNGQIENTLYCRDFHITNIDNKYYLVYRRQVKDSFILNIAQSQDLLQWQQIAEIPSIQEPAELLPIKKNGQFVLIVTKLAKLHLAYSKDLKQYEIEDKPVIPPRPSAFDKFPLEHGGIFAIDKGLLFVYFVKELRREGETYSAGAILLDKNDFHSILWRSDTPIWRQPDEWTGKIVYPLGVVQFKKQFIFYFGIAHEEVVAVLFGKFDKIFNPKKIFPTPVLQKHLDNPIITPVLQHKWESQSTFNAAAVYEDNKIHLLYRAQGDGNTSVLGYANSSDGLSIDERSDTPAYVPREPFETPWRQPFAINRQYMSGGGYGGCEDPRLTKIDNKFYLTYVAFNGIDPPRIAISSIEVENFVQKKWNWSKPKIISKSNLIDKNACLFPEKIQGKYVMLHRIFPNMQIDFLDDLEFNEPLKGEFVITPRENAWDSRKVGAGAPPIKTKDGWLLIYHAVDDRDDSQYKMGAMLLDLNDPRKVHYRSIHPILRPTEWYENNGYKAGVTYPCGAVVVKGTLFVYYGGADTVLCAATKNLSEFLKELKESSPITLDPLPKYQSIMTI